MTVVRKFLTYLTGKELKRDNIFFIGTRIHNLRIGHGNIIFCSTPDDIHSFWPATKYNHLSRIIYSTLHSQKKLMVKISQLEPCYKASAWQVPWVETLSRNPERQSNAQRVRQLGLAEDGCESRPHSPLCCWRS